MTLQTPSPENGYTVDSLHVMSPDLFNEIFGSIHERLVEREELEGTFENLIAQGTQAALDLIQVNIAPELGELQQAIQTAFDNIAIIVEGVAPNSVLLNSQPASYYLNPANFSTSATIKSFMAADDQAEARTAIGAASATGVATALDAVADELATKAPAADVTAALDTKLDKAGGAMTGPLRLPAGTEDAAPLRMPHGTAPGESVNGDLWMTTAGLIARFNNAIRTFWHSGNMALVTEGEARSGTAATARAWTAQRIAQAIDSLETKPEVGLFTGSGTNATNFPLGHPLMVVHGTPINRNTDGTVRLDDSSSQRYTIGGAGSVLSGTWRARGRDGSLNATLFQRTA